MSHKLLAPLRRSFSFRTRKKNEILEVRDFDAVVPACMIGDDNGLSDLSFTATAILTRQHAHLASQGWEIRNWGPKGHFSKVLEVLKRWRYRWGGRVVSDVTLAPSRRKKKSQRPGKPQP